MRNRALAVVAVLSLASRCLALEKPGSTSAPVLQIPMGSRALGMGSAFTAVASDISALYYNPAGLSRLNAHEAAFTYVAGLTDNSLQQIAYGAPLPFSGISGNGYSSLGASLLFAQDGTIEINQTNADGSFQSSKSVSAGNDFVGTIGYSERVGATPIDVKDATFGVNHFIGITGKYIRSTLVSQYSDHAFTTDIGYLVNSPEAGVSFGLSALNVTGKLKYGDTADPLPTTLRSGLAYQGSPAAGHVVTVASDAEYLLNEQQWHVNVGVEYFLAKSYGFRIGYQFMQDAVGLTAGFGFRWKSRVLIDYAWVNSSSLSDEQRFTISYRFGGVAPSIRGRPRRPYIEAVPEKEQLRHLDEETPAAPPAPRPRPATREERPAGVPGWIY